MAEIRIEGDELVIEQSLVDHLLSLRSTLRFPIAQVDGITWDPGVAAEPKGLRVPGTHIPGLVVAGTFRHEGEKVFWNIRRGTHAVVIRLRDAEFQQLVVEVDDPQGTVDAVNAARAQHAL